MIMNRVSLGAIIIVMMFLCGSSWAQMISKTGYRTGSIVLDDNLVENNTMQQTLDPQELPIEQKLQENSSHHGTTALSTLIPGANYTTDTTWDVAGSPYLVSGDINVNNGAKLTIDPGVVVQFAANTDVTSSGNYSNKSELRINTGSSLIAEGTVTDSIIFISDAGNPQPGDWGGIFVTFGHASIAYARIQHSVYAVYSHWPTPGSVVHSFVGSLSQGGVYINGGTATAITIGYNTIYGFPGGYSGIFAQGTDTLTVIENNHVSNPTPVGYAVTSSNARVKILNNTISSVNDGIFVTEASVIVKNNTITSVGTTGISLGRWYLGTATPIVEENTIQSYNRGIWIDGNMQPIIHYNNLNGCTYYGIQNNTSNTIDARYNWWGAGPTAEMSTGANPKNISYIWDIYDLGSKGFVNYAHWLIGPFLPDLGTPTLVSPSDGAIYQSIKSRVVWNQVPEATSYHAQIGSTFDFDTMIQDSAFIADTSCRMNMFLFSTQYYWRVQSMVDDSVGRWSNEWDFTTADPSSIAGLKFSDHNGNSIQDPGDSALSNWQINLSGDTTMSLLTDVEGNYTFDSLDAGSYILAEEQQNGWRQVAPSSPSSYSILLGPGVSLGGYKFGNRQQFIINASSSTNGTILPSGDVIIEYGEDTVFTIIPDPGFHLDSLFVDDILVDSIGSYTFRSVISNHTIHAVFTPNDHTITVIQREHGTITPGTIDVPHGDNQTFVIIPDAGYHVDSVLVDDSKIDSLTSYTFINVTTPHNLTAYYSINMYTLAIDIIGNGMVTKEPDQPTYNHGTNVQLTATPSDHTWTFDGWSEDTISTVNPIFILMDRDKNITATFLQDSAYLLSYRTFLPESLALDRDNKEKINKYVQRKPDKVEFTVEVVCDSSNITDFHIEFISAIDTTTANLTVEIPFGATIGTSDAKLKKWDINFGSPIGTGSHVRLHGFAWNKKSQKVSKYWWTRTGTIVGKSSKLATLTNQPRFPMPNRVNALYETMLNNAVGYSPHGFVVGRVMKTSTMDSSKQYGWLQTVKYGDILQTLIVKRTLKMHGADPHGFDKWLNNNPLVRQQKKLIPTKYDNVLLADLIALKLNITASAMGITRPGFGELIYEDSSYIESLQRVNSFNGMTVRAINERADSLMMGYYSGGEHRYYDADRLYRNLHWSVPRINQAFEGHIDTTHFADSLRYTGVRALADVPYLRANPSTIPMRITMINPLRDEEPTEYVLYQNYPNPFNPVTTISFNLPMESSVTLTIYNVLGQEVATLIQHELMDEGEQEVTFDATYFPSGVYFYRLHTSDFVATKKLILVK